jgi:hypothetical protein
MQMWKPKHGASQKFRDCSREYGKVRECVIREKRMFNAIIQDQKLEGPDAIPNYLSMKFKEKEENKKKMKMMGEDHDTMAAKMEQMEKENQTDIKIVDVEGFKKKREMGYM